MGLVFYQTGVYDRKRDVELSGDRYLASQSAITLRWQDSKAWTFPIEPSIEITGGNNIVMRSVLKVDEKKARRGTIKELWQQEDYKIRLSGVIISDEDNAWEDDDLMQLRNFCEERKPVYIGGSAFSTLRIDRCVITSWNLPATIGETVQEYSLELYSDDEYELLVSL